MTESDDGTDNTTGNNDDLGGVLGEVGLEYEDESDDKTEIDHAANVPAGDEPSAQNTSDGPFAPEPGMQLTESLGTKLTPPEKEFIELYVEFSDEYDHPGAFLRAFVDQLRQEYGEEVMRRKKALDELKGGL